MAGKFTGYGILLHIEGFSARDQKILQRVLLEKYGWKTTLHTKENKYKSLYVPKKHFPQLKE
jgi:hypothetical protein